MRTYSSMTHEHPPCVGAKDTRFGDTWTGAGAPGGPALPGRSVLVWGCSWATHTHTHTDTHTHAHTHIHTHTHTHTRHIWAVRGAFGPLDGWSEEGSARADPRTPAHARVRTHTHTHTHARAHTHTQLLAHARTHTRKAGSGGTQHGSGSER